MSVAEALPRRPLAELPGAQTPTWFVRGYTVFHVLFALSEVGFFRELEVQGAVAPDPFAEAEGLDRPSLEALLRYLYGLGVLNHDADGRYTPGAGVGELDLALVRMFSAYGPLFHGLVSVLRREKTYGREIVRDPELDAEASGRICRRFSYPRIVETVEDSGARSVLDLGCGSGELLIEICRRCPAVRATGIDLSPAVVRRARRRVEEEGLGERIRLVAGDLLELEDVLAPEEREAVDLAVSSAVFHEFAYSDLEGLVRALESVRRAVPGARVLLAEALEQEDEALRRTASHVLEHHLFHRLSQQGIATREGWSGAFPRAGYRVAREVPLDPGGVIFVLEEEASR